MNTRKHCALVMPVLMCTLGFAIEVQSQEDRPMKRALEGTWRVTGRPGPNRPPFIVEVSKQRTKADYCRFQQRVTATWPEAEKIVLVQENLNTHNPSSFYEDLPAVEAFDLAQGFEMHCTPKKGSWLNMAELELSALSRICLNRRITSLEGLDGEVQSLVKERNRLKIKVEWQFSIAQARAKLSRHHEKVKFKS